MAHEPQAHPQSPQRLSARSYVPYQMLENKQMLLEILHEPQNVLQAIRRYSNSLTTAMTFGWHTFSNEDQTCNNSS